MRITHGLLAACLAVSLAGCSDKKPPRQPKPTATQTTAYVAMARGKVEVQGGLLELKPLQPGRLTHLAVAEGDTVERGAELATLDDQSARTELKTHEAELVQAKARQKAAEQRLPPARQRAQQLQRAARQGAVDPQQATEAQQQVQQFESAQAIAKAGVEIARQHVALARNRLAERVLHAPQAGTVVRVNATLGALVSPEDAKPLLVILPERPLQIRAELNESFVHRVKPGMTADVVLEAEPGQPPLKAHVTRLGDLFGSSQLDDGSQGHPNVRVVDCLLAFDQPPTLRIGQNVRVNFHE
jgi:multidrug resistance efflux pump